MALYQFYQDIRDKVIEGIRAKKNSSMDYLWPERVEFRRETAAYVHNRDKAIMEQYMDNIIDAQGQIDQTNIQSAHEYLSRHAPNRRRYIARNGTEEQIKEFDALTDILRANLRDYAQ